MSDAQQRRPTCLIDSRGLPQSETELADAQAWLARFGGLIGNIKSADGPALFVSRAGAASRVVIEQFDGGRDAQYIVISRKVEQPSLDRLGILEALPPREMIGFLPQVAGTDIIYDLTDETLQGKARPFVCDLTIQCSRVYAVLPVQIETIALTSIAAPEGRAAQLEFRDARGERMQAALPFHFRAEAEGEELKAGYYATERNGRFHFSNKLLADLPAGSQLFVRSQLTGRVENHILR